VQSSSAWQRELGSVPSDDGVASLGTGSVGGGALGDGSLGDGALGDVFGGGAARGDPQWGTAASSASESAAAPAIRMYALRIQSPCAHRIRAHVALRRGPGHGHCMVASRRRIAMQADENTFLDLERKYWQAIQDGDTETLMAMNDDPCLVAGASGVASIDQEKFAAMMSGATWKLDSFEIDDDAQVRMLGDDVAIVAYRVTEKLTVDEKPVTIEAADTSTWVRRDGRWLCALHTEALKGDPFGRDRKKAPARKAKASD
jgi:hypothetical protein